MRQSDQSKQNNYRFFLSLLFRIIVFVGFLFVLTPFILAVFNDDNSLISNKNQSLFVNLNGLKTGEIKKITVAYIPVWIYKRSTVDIEQLSGNTDLLADPVSKHSIQPTQYHNQYRSKVAKYFVFKPIESIRSCNIRFLDNPDTRLAQLLTENNISWSGGFTESCYGSVYDLSGRRYQSTGNKNQKNLAVPEYSIELSSINNTKQQGDVIQFEFKLMVMNK